MADTAMDTTPETAPAPAAAPEPPKELSSEEALRVVLRDAVHADGIVRGLREVAKAISRYGESKKITNLFSFLLRSVINEFNISEQTTPLYSPRNQADNCFYCHILFRETPNFPLVLI